MLRSGDSSGKLSSFANQEARLWAAMTARFDQASFSDIRVLVLGFETVERTWLRNSLRFIGVRVTATAPNVGQLAGVADMGLSFTHVIANLDGFESVEDAVDALLDFRQRAPKSCSSLCHRGCRVTTLGRNAAQSATRPCLCP